MQWKSYKKYLDVETGEEIKESEAKKNYIIIKKESKSYITNGNGRREIIVICKKSNQLTIF